MKRFFLLILTLAGSFAWAARPLSTAAENHSHETNAFTPDTIPWGPAPPVVRPGAQFAVLEGDRKSTRLNSSHRCISYAVFCLKKKNSALLGRDEVGRAGELGDHDDLEGLLLLTETVI